jgi:hypothetical protein
MIEVFKAEGSHSTASLLTKEEHFASATGRRFCRQFRGDLRFVAGNGFWVIIGVM